MVASERRRLTRLFAVAHGAQQKIGFMCEGEMLPAGWRARLDASHASRLSRVVASYHTYGKALISKSPTHLARHQKRTLGSIPH